MDSCFDVGLTSSFLLSLRNDRLQLILVKCDIDQCCFVCPCSSVCLDSFPKKDTPIDEPRLRIRSGRIEVQFYNVWVVAYSICNLSFLHKP